jgi:hypothetical protein
VGPRAVLDAVVKRKINGLYTDIHIWEKRICNNLGESLSLTDFLDSIHS